MKNTWALAAAQPQQGTVILAAASRLQKVQISRCNSTWKASCASKPPAGARSQRQRIPGSASKASLTWLPHTLEGILLLCHSNTGAPLRNIFRLQGKKASVSSSQPAQTEGSDPRCWVSTCALFPLAVPCKGQELSRALPRVCQGSEESTGRA